MRRRSDISVVEIIDFRNSHHALASEQFDAVVVIGSAKNVHWQMSRWRSEGVTTVLWCTEDPHEVKNNVAYQDEFDIIFSNDRVAQTFYNYGTHFLPLAGSLDYHKFDLKSDEELDYDLLFVGTAWPNRVDALNKLLRTISSDFKVKVALPSNIHLPEPRLENRDLIYDWRCSPSSFARLANRSRVTLTLDRVFSSSSEALAGSTPPPRLFELALAGTAQVYVTDSEEIEHYFETSSEVIVEKSIDLALPNIMSILKEPIKRHSYALRSQARALRDHTYDRRLDELIKTIHEYAGTKKAPITAQLEQGRTAKRRVLIVAHNVEGKRPGGGVEVYLSAIQPLLRRSYDVYLLTPEELDSRTVLELTLPSGMSIRYETRSSFSSEYISSPEIEEIFFNIVIRHNIELVHFNHLLMLPLSLPVIAKTAGAATILTVHDYYIVCDNFNLLSYDDKFCEFYRKSPAHCDICLNKTKGLAYGSQAVRRNAVARALQAVDLCIFNTDSSRRIVREVYNLPDSASCLIEMLMPSERFFPENSVPPASANTTRPPLIVKIPGNFTKQKGAYSLVDLMKLLETENVEFHILGREDDIARQMLDRETSLKVRRTGGYRHQDISLLLKGGDVSINYAIWPETYMISLSESWAAGLVPIVSDLGAPGERVTDDRDGFIVPVGDIGSIADKIRLLSNDRLKLDEMKQFVLGKPIVRPQQHVNMLIDKYEALTSALKARPQSAKRRDMIAFDRALYSERHTNNKWSDVETLWDSDYNNKHLSSATNIENVPAFPVSDLPMKYRHLPRMHANGELLLQIKQSYAQAYSQNTSMKRQLYSELRRSSKQTLVDAFVRCFQDGGALLFRLDTIAGEPSLYRLSGQVPAATDLRDVDLIIVFDGFILECPGIAAKEGSFVSFDTDASWVHDEQELVEACDHFSKIETTGGILVVAGWAADPMTPQFSRQGYIMFENQSGRRVVSQIVRNSNIRREQEGALDSTGFSWTCAISDLQKIYGPDTLSLKMSIVQKVNNICITSGIYATISLGRNSASSTNGNIKLDTAPEILQRIIDLIRSKQPHLEENLARSYADLILNFFDLRYYSLQLIRRRSAVEEKRNLLTHYLIRGELEGLMPSPLFSPEIYARSNPEIATYKPLLLHYLLYGSKEGRVASAADPVVHEDAPIVFTHMDAEHYKLQAFGGERFSGSIAQHYIIFGEPNNLWPTRYFDPSFYRRMNPDIGRTEGCLFAHYLVHGRQEGRRPSAESPIMSDHTNKKELVERLFDVGYYTSQVSYINNTDIDPICHYFEYGYRSGLMPNPTFQSQRAKITGDSDDVKFINWCRTSADR